MLDAYSAGRLAVIKKSTLTQMTVHVHEERDRIRNTNDDDNDNDSHNLCQGNPFQSLNPFSLHFLVIV